MAKASAQRRQRQGPDAPSAIPPLGPPARDIVDAGLTGLTMPGLVELMLVTLDHLHRAADPQTSDGK
jgi:hypothetical protein